MLRCIIYVVKIKHLYINFYSIILFGTFQHNIDDIIYIIHTNVIVYQ